MLWTDAIFVTSADLATLDSEVSSVASAEELTLDGDSGICARAVEESARALQVYLQSWGGICASGGSGLSLNHLAAVYNVGGDPSQVSRASLHSVVVSGRTRFNWSALKNWVAYNALAAVCRSAMNRGADRYEEKYLFYKRDIAEKHWPHLQASGLAIVRTPLPCPASVLSRDPGTWEAIATAGSGTTDGDIDVVITYTGASASYNNKSHPSAIKTVTLSSGEVLEVDISGLNPPSEQDAAEMYLERTQFLAATHWNIYAAASGETPRLQVANIPVGTKSYTLDGDITSSGPLVGIGQYPDIAIPLQNLRFRA